MMRGMFRGNGGGRGRGFRGGGGGGGGGGGPPNRFQGNNNQQQGFQQQNRPQNLLNLNVQPQQLQQNKPAPQQTPQQQQNKPQQPPKPSPNNQTPQKPAAAAAQPSKPQTPATPAKKPEVKTPAAAPALKKEVSTPAVNAVNKTPVQQKPAEQSKNGPSQTPSKPFNSQQPPPNRQQNNSFDQQQQNNPFNQQQNNGGPFNQGQNFNQQHNNSSFNNNQQQFNQNQNNSFNNQQNPFNQGGGSGGNKFQNNRPYQNNMNNSRGGPRTMEERLNERVAALSGPTYELPPTEEKEVKFSGHCRLYVGNITSDMSDDDVKNMFTPFGEPSEIFVNKEKNFAFVKMDYRSSAEKAKSELDGMPRRGKLLKVRFAPHGAIIKVKNLNPSVSNELLEMAFSVFGEIERAYVITDDRGKSTGAGIVEFQRKPAATLAVRKCSENCFFLTSSLRPVIVEFHEEVTDAEGLPEKNMFKKSGEYTKEREVGPRFANINSFEHDYGTRWKQLFELRKQKLESVEREMKLEEEKLEAQMEYAKYEHETEMLRDQLRQREMDRDRQKRDWEMKERQQEEQRRKDDEMMRRQQEEMQMRIMRQEEDLRRRQAENTLFMQAHQLNNMLDKQEQAMLDDDFTGTPDNFGSRGPGNLPVDPKAFMDSFDRGSRSGGASGGVGGAYDDEMDLLDRDMERGGGGGNGRFGGGGGRSNNAWDFQSPGGGRRSADDFPNKRQRRH